MTIENYRDFSHDIKDENALMLGDLKTLWKWVF